MRYCILVCCFMSLAANLFGQSQRVSVAQRPVSEQQWNKAADNLDYSKDVPAPEKNNPKPPVHTPDTPPDFNFKLWGDIAQILAILLAIFAIAFGIYRMLQQPRNRRIARDGAEITEENLETYLHETDLDQFLHEALQRGDYPQAVRIRFLQIIRRLSESGDILWAKEKTNRDYLREMRAHPQFAVFQRATHTFERIWYGNAPLDAEGFARLEPDFKALL